MLPSRKNNLKKKIKPDMPPKGKENQDVFEKSRKISGRWFDSIIKKDSSHTSSSARERDNLPSELHRDEERKINNP